MADFEMPYYPPPVLTGRTRQDRPPAFLCPAHTAAWREWRNVIDKYSSANPKEWPGSGHIMDSRTTHAERRRTWAEKNAGQMELVEKICRSGKSPQCNRPEES